MSDAPTSSNEEDVMVNTISSKTVRGNVFAVLDFDDPEEELAKAAIITRIERAFARGLEPSAAAPALGWVPGVFDALFHGVWQDTTLDQLLRTLRALGTSVSITLSDANGEGTHLRVMTA